ncbi:MAG: amylo-alpha-1,6-glucosidase [Candidatus Thorarchaeota archaeon]
MIQLDDADLKLNRAVTFEWLYTNGLGGYASSTVVGLNTRGYHGLLMSSLSPPVDRWLSLSRLDEVVATSQGEFSLATEQTVSGVVNRGYRMLQRFEMNPLPQMTYEADGVTLLKTVFMGYRRNLTVVNYELKNSIETVLTVTPFQTCRTIHARPQKLDFTPEVEAIDDNSYFSFDERPNSPWMFSYTPDAEFTPSEVRVNEAQVYRREKEMGLPHLEELYIPGVFHTTLEPGEHFLSFLFAVSPTRKQLLSELGSLAKAQRKDFARLRFEELRRRKVLNDRAYSMSPKVRDEDIEWLVMNADSFIVDRASTGMRSVIAGYHQLADIGLDALISLSGLTMSIGRFQDARAVLTTYARHSRYGLVANLRGIIWDTMESVIAAFRIGTKYNIHEDHDGLICSGIEGIEVSWMNEKVGNWIATPRVGKCVETNALWYNSLMAMADMSELLGRDPYEFRAVASWIKEAFVQTFYDDKLGYLYDVVTDTENDASIRPNQIFAISLPFPLLDHKDAVSVLKTVTKELLTPFGLRTLSPQDARYARANTGGPRSRADATHHGTVHPWLIGPYISAFLSLMGRTPENKAHAETEFFRPVLSAVRRGALGTISGMFDGSKPHRDRGCVSRARNVAELLRVYFEEL